MRIANLVVILVACMCFLSSSYVMAEEFTFEQEKTFEVGKEGAVLKLANMSGKAVVESHSQDKIIIHATKAVKAKDQEEANKIAGKVEINIRKEGSTITVETKFPKFKSRGFWKNLLGLDWGDGVWVDYHISVPTKTKMDIRTASGDVSIKDIEEKVDIGVASGSVMLENIKGGIGITSASGDIELYNIQGDADLTGASSSIKIRRAKGNIDIRTASGDVYGEKVEGDLSISQASGDLELLELNGDITAETASGGMNIEQKQGSLNLTSSSGDIKAKTDISPNKEYFIQSTSGNVRLYIPSQSKADFRLETTSGNINCKAPVELHTATSKKIEGKINNGGAQIKIQTTSGDIFLVGE